MRIEKYRLIMGLLLFAFWVCALLPFPLQEITRNENMHIVSSIWMLGEVTIFLLGIWTMRNLVDIAVVAIFFVLSFCDTVWLNGLSIPFWLNGTRIYLCMLFMLPIVRYFWSDPVRRAYLVAKMDRVIYVYLCIQFPCMVYQCILYGAYDYVSGSIGWMYSGATSTIIYLSSFYLMQRRWDKSKGYMANLKANAVLLFLLIPSFLNETKVSFIYLAMYFFFLVPIDRKFIKRMVIIGPLIVIVMGVAGWLYTTMVAMSGHEDEVALADYVMGSDQEVEWVELVFDNDGDEEYTGDFARGLKFYVLPFIFERHPGSWLTGFGVGQLKGGNSMDKTEFAKQYEWVLRGTTIQIFTVLIEMGVPGGVLYILFWITSMRLWRRHRGERNLQFSWMLGLTIALLSVYIYAFQIPPFAVQVMYMVFVCSRWNGLPPYVHVPLLGNRKFTFSCHD